MARVLRSIDCRNSTATGAPPHRPPHRRRKPELCLRVRRRDRIANRDAGYRRVVDGGMFALCDGSFVPLYVRWICGLRYEPILRQPDLPRHRGLAPLPDGVPRHVAAENPRPDSATQPPEPESRHWIRCSSANCCRSAASRRLRLSCHRQNGGRREPDIIWIALGSAQSEIFMHRLERASQPGSDDSRRCRVQVLQPGQDVRRPEWMVRRTPRVPPPCRKAPK